jgi:hypothetical protein
MSNWKFVVNIATPETPAELKLVTDFRKVTLVVSRRSLQIHQFLRYNRRKCNGS